MFVLSALLTLGIITFLALRDWICASRFSSKTTQRSIKKISQYISLQEWEKASNELNSLISKGKSGKELMLFEAQVLRGTQQLNRALQKVETACAHYPDELLFKLEKGKILSQMGKAKEALEYFKVCTPILRGESDLLIVGTALYQAGFYQQCLHLLHPLLETTQNGQLVSLCGEAFFQLKKFSQAITMYTQAIQLGIDTHQVISQLGHAYRRLGNLAESEKIFRQLLEKDPGDVVATLGLGLCYQERGQPHKALLIYQAGVAWEVKDSSVLYQAGLCALRTKKNSLAQKCFFELLSKKERDPQILAYYGLSLENQKKWQEAEQTYLQLIQLFPSYVQGYRALGWLFGVGLSQTLSAAEGLNVAHRAMKLKNDPVAWEILSACYARVGNFDRAYQIQMLLSKSETDGPNRARRQKAMRKLRKKTPLDDHHVLRALVA